MKITREDRNVQRRVMRVASIVADEYEKRHEYQCKFWLRRLDDLIDGYSGDLKESFNRQYNMLRVMFKNRWGY